MDDIILRRRLVGDGTTLDEDSARQLRAFARTTIPLFTRPGRQHEAGWLWSAQLAGLDMSEVNALTVVGRASYAAFNQVACLIMHGQISHILRVTSKRAFLSPVGEPEWFREEIGSAPDWFSCPFGSRRRCECAITDPVNAP